MDSHHGPVIAIFHQYAHMGSGKSIHSSIQLEAFGLEVNDKSCMVAGGRQQIVTPDGYIHPLQIKDGLAYTSMQPYTDKEWMTLPHVHWTQDKDWDPSVLDHSLGNHDKEWFDAMADITELPNKHLFDEFRNYRHCTANMENQVTESSQALSIAIHAREVHTREPDYIALRPHFGYSSEDIVKRTFQATTQLGRLSSATHLKWQYHSPNPALNVHHHNEHVTTDTVYADTDDTSKVICKSSLQPALSMADRNKHVDFLDGEELTPVLKSPDGERSQAKPLPVFDPSNLIGWTFLMKHKGDGEPATAKIIKEITDRDSRLADQPKRKCFLASINDDEFQEVVSYNEILDHIAWQGETEEPTDLWKFQ